MISRIVISDGAADDVFQIALYIAQDSPVAADRFVIAARRAYEFLVRFPRAGTPYRTQFPALRGLRSYRIREFPGYRVFYVPHPDDVEVLYVIHGSRDVPAVLVPR